MGVETGNINIDKIACAVVIYGTRLTECEVYETFIRRNLQSLDCLLVFDNSPAKLCLRMSVCQTEYSSIIGILQIRACQPIITRRLR